MCKAPKPPAPKEPKKPQFLRNRYLDEFVGGAAAVNSIKAGRGSLRIPMGSPTPITGRQPGDSLVRQAPTVTHAGPADISSRPRAGQTGVRDPRRRINER
jgi:hypothetical protein